MVNIRTFTICSLLILVYFSETTAATLTFNSLSPSENEMTREAWLNASGITDSQFLIDFESGFIDGQNISGSTDIFPNELIIIDTSSSHRVSLEGGSIGGSSPIGTLAIEHNERPFLRLDFSASPVDYVAFQDIDQAGTNGIITFVGGGNENLSFETTGGGGDSAEFFGIFRNDMPRIALIDLDASGDGQWALDNIEYGIVPIPPAIVLFVSGFLGLSLVARRKAVT